jgi:hypothetical protein
MPSSFPRSPALLLALACVSLACGDSTASLETGSTSAATTGSGDDVSSHPEDTGSGSTDTSSGSDERSTSDANGDVSTGISDDTTSTGGESTSDDGDDAETTGGIDLSCVDLDVGSALGQGLAVGWVAGHGNDVANPCSFESQDYVVRFTAPYDGVFSFSLADSDGCQDTVCEWGQQPHGGTTMVILDEHCAGPVLACNEALAALGTPNVWLPFSWARRVLAEGQTVLVAIGGPAQFDLSITGVPLGTDESCVDIDLGQTVGPGVAQGDLSTSEDDLVLVAPTYFHDCSNTTPYPEDVLLFTAPATGTYLFTALGTPQISKRMMLLPAGCEVSSEHVFACGEGTQVYVQTPPPGTRLTADLVADQPILVVIEGSADDYTLDIAANATPGGTCCGPRKSWGCSVPSIEACVCEADGHCCVENWDMWCANRARFLCDASCID